MRERSFRGLILPITRILVLSVIVLVPGREISAQVKWRIAAQLNVGRHHHAARYLPGDRIIVMGGWVGSMDILDGSTTNTTELVDLNSGAVTQGPAMRDARAEFPTLVLPDGDILVFGGHSNGIDSRSIERLDVQTMTWSTVGTMMSGRRQHAADFINADSILIFGGFGNSTAEIFELAKGSTSRVSSLPSNANQAASVNPDGRGPSYFGFRTGGPNSPRSSTSLRYSFSSGTWEQDLEFTHAPVAPRVTPLADGSVFVAGGAIRELPVECSRYSWTVSPSGLVTAAPDLLVGRVHQSMGTWGSQRVLVGGGLGDNAAILKSCEWVDLAKGTVTSAPALNVERCYAPMIIAPSADGRKRAFVISGLQTGRNTPTIEVLEDSVCTRQIKRFELSELRLAGAATKDESSIRLTSTTKYETGGAFLRDRVTVRNGFDLRFSFRLNSGNDNGMLDGGDAGADGIAVVFLPENPTALGRAGDGIGYHEIPHGMAVEYDSYLNAAFSDPNGSHVAVQVGDGRQLRAWHMAPYLKAIATKGVPSFVANGSVYHGRIMLAGKRLSVYVSQTGQFADPVLTLDDFDIQSALNLDSRGSCFIGFTSSTGMSSEEHHLMSVSIEDCQPLISGISDDVGPQPGAAFAITPNPVSGSVMVQLKAPLSQWARLEVVDVHGREILRQELPEGTVSIPIEQSHQLPSGLYHVRILSASSFASQPMSVVR